MSEYGYQILLERKRRGILQSELAAELGWNNATLVDVENERVPSGEATYNLAVTAMDKIQENKTTAA